MHFDGQPFNIASVILRKSGRLLVGKASVVRVVSQEVPQASYLPNFQSIICNGQTKNLIVFQKADELNVRGKCVDNPWISIINASPFLLKQTI
ncbi:MAG: hypothetical protein AB1638_09160 [Nitrospirota bacterium]